MNSPRLRRLLVIVVALIGAALNGIYGYQLVTAFLVPQTDAATRQILVPAIALEFSWMALLLWVSLKPFERRAILIFAGATLFGANLLSSYSQWLTNPGDLTPILINTAIGLAFFALFLLAYFAARPKDVASSVD
jgi:FtsH-binding integral membrane protein